MTSSRLCVQRIVAALMPLILTGCINSSCHSLVKSQIAAPDVGHVAALFQRDCGATTAVAQVVALRKRNADFNGDDLNSYVFTTAGEGEIRTVWKNASTLIIEHTSIRKDIFVQLTNFDGVQIIYIKN